MKASSLAFLVASVLIGCGGTAGSVAPPAPADPLADLVVRADRIVWPDASRWPDRVGAGHPLTRRKIAALPEPRGGATATLLKDGRVLILGGHRAGDSELFLDPSTGAVAKAPLPPATTSEHTTTRLPSGDLIVIGGRTPEGATGQVVRIDAAATTATAVAALPRARYGHTATLLSSGQILVVGGYDDPGTSTRAPRLDPETFLFDPAKQTSQSAGALPQGTADHRATLLRDGRVLVTGVAGDGAPGRAFLFDPSATTWRVVAALPVEQHGQSATLLDDGRVLLAGGKRSGGGHSVSVRETFLYDPARDRWSPGEPLPDGRTGHRAARLADGTVLLIGGGSWGDFASGGVDDDVVLDRAGRVVAQLPAAESDLSDFELIALADGDQLLVAGTVNLEPSADVVRVDLPALDLVSALRVSLMPGRRQPVRQIRVQSDYLYIDPTHRLRATSSEASSARELRSETTVATTPPRRFSSKVLEDVAFSGPAGRTVELKPDERMRAWILPGLDPVGLILRALPGAPWTRGQYWMDRLPPEEVGGERFEVISIRHLGRPVRARMYLDRSNRPRFLVAEVAGKTTSTWYGDYREVAGLALPHEVVAVTDSNRVIGRVTSYSIE